MSSTATAGPILLRRPRVLDDGVVLLVAAAAMVGTLPGRTQGLGLITEPLLADLAIDRVSYAAVNFWATIIGAGFAVGIGRLQERLGTRAVLAATALALGAVVCLMSRATALPALAVWITLTRGLGQSALSVVSLAAVGRAFVGRVDVPMAIYTVAISVGFMIAFPVVGSLVQAWGWRAAWLAVGVVLAGVVAPAGWWLLGRSPDAAEASGDAGRDGYAWDEALATPAFWVFAAGAALYGLVASGIGLFNESILAERGFGPGVYYQTLVVTALTALVGNFLGGWLALRVPLTALLAASLLVLTGGLLALPHVSALPHVWAWATAMGLGGGLVMVLFFSVWPRVYGRRHLPRIQGAAQALTVLASAIGPLLLAWCVEWTGSYQAMFRILAAIIAATAAAALAVPLPQARNRTPASHA
jgi:MFS family permease